MAVKSTPIVHHVSDPTQAAFTRATVEQYLARNPGVVSPIPGSTGSKSRCARRYPVDITVHFCGPTVKQLRREWHVAVQRGQSRLIRHISAHLEVGAGVPVAEVAQRVGVHGWHRLSLAAGLPPAALGQLARRHSAGPPQRAAPHTEGALEGPGRGRPAGGGLCAGGQVATVMVRPSGSQSKRCSILACLNACSISARPSLKCAHPS
jgi:hypothetical protein